MTRAFVQIKINDFIEEGKSGLQLYEAMVAWINSQDITEAEKTRIISDLNSYDGLEGVS